MKELYPKKPRELTEEEESELDKTIKFSGNKLFDTFNIGKSIWNLVYDTVQISLKKNKHNFNSRFGYIFHYEKEEKKVFVWEYEMKKAKIDDINNKTYLNLIYEGSPNETKLNFIIDTFSKWNQMENYTDFPVFEMKCFQKFPMEQTLVPIMKRKIMAYIFQVAGHEKLDNFDK